MTPRPASIGEAKAGLLVSGIGPPALPLTGAKLGSRRRVACRERGPSFRYRSARHRPRCHQQAGRTSAIDRSARARERRRSCESMQFGRVSLRNPGGVRCAHSGRAPSIGIGSDRPRVEPATDRQFWRAHTRASTRRSASTELLGCLPDRDVAVARTGERLAVPVTPPLSQRHPGKASHEVQF